jgi:4-amino-4-deoxy-L-arabinose transferase-like glycosyltransferase
VSVVRRSAIPPLGAALAPLLVIAATSRWLALDSQLPDYDTAKHLISAWSYSDSLRAWDLLEPFRAYTAYPPLDHIVGAVATLIAGRNVAPPILAVALVFAPLLALGLYRAGSTLGNQWTGLLAVIFAFGTPMIVTEFRAYMLETPATALLAVAVWLLIASRRFEAVLPAAAAGVAVGLGMLTKQSFAFFIAGFLAVLVLRGGWRNRRGLLAFGAIACAIGLPWYVVHWEDLRATSEWTLGQNSEGPIWGSRNIGFYAWDFVNRQFMLPLLALAAVGAVVSSVRFLRDRSRADHTPELLAGAIVAWAALTFYLKVKSSYYTLPLTVFAALLGTVWLARVRARPARLVAAGLGLVAGVNFAATAFHVGDPPGVRVALPGADAATAGQQAVRYVTLVSPEAWPAGLDAGEHGAILNLLRALKGQGVRQVEFNAANDLAYYNSTGFTALTTIAGIPRAPTYAPQTLEAPHDAIFGREVPVPGGPPVCTTLGDGSAVTITLGPPSSGRRVCPSDN